MRKLLSSILVLLLIASILIMVESTSAQSISKLSAPEFTIELVDESYDVPPTTKSTTNYYTNETTTTTIPGYHV